MEDRASVLLLCKHFCFPPQEQPEGTTRNTGPLPSLGREGTPCWGKELVRTKSVAHSCTARQEQCP